MTVEKIDRDIAALKEQRKLAKLEADFVAKKEAGTLTVEDRQKLRAARAKYRSEVRQPVEDGAAPAAVGSALKAEEV